MGDQAAELAAMQGKMQKMMEMCKKLRDGVTERDATISDLNGKLGSAAHQAPDDELAAMQTKMQKMMEMCKKLRDGITERDATISDLNGKLEGGPADVPLSSNPAELEAMQSKMQSMVSMCKKLRDGISERDAKIAEMSSDNTGPPSESETPAESAAPTPTEDAAAMQTKLQNAMALCKKLRDALAQKDMELKKANEKMGEMQEQRVPGATEGDASIEASKVKSPIRALVHQDAEQMGVQLAESEAARSRAEAELSEMKLELSKGEEAAAAKIAAAREKVSVVAIIAWL